MSTTRSYGRYTLLEPLGSELGLDAFRAKSLGVEGFEKTIVIKRLQSEWAAKPRFLATFLRHARLAMRLSHANVVQVFDLGRLESSDGDSYYLAMEHVAGLSLADVIAVTQRRAERLPVELCLYVAAEVAKALDHAHRRRDERLRPLGIVHAGLCPEAVVLSWDGEVKVADFGVAVAMSELHREGEHADGPALEARTPYMSPEQLATGELSAASDLFALGALVFELLAHERAFDGLDRTSGKLPRLEGSRADLTPKLIEVVQRLLSAVPSERGAAAGQVYEELRAEQYALGGRFGASELSDFLERAREQLALRTVPPPHQPSLLPSIEPPPHPPPAAFAATAVPAGGPEPAAEDASQPALINTELEQRFDVAAMVIRFTAGAPENGSAIARRVIERYGGDYIGERGSSLLCVFGIKEPEPRHLENAVRSALVVTRSVVQLAAIGISAGVVNASALPTVTENDPLQVLFKAAETLVEGVSRGVVVGAEQAALLDGLFVLRRTAEGGGERRTCVVEDVKTPALAYGRFVGRKPELAALAEMVVSASKKRPQVATIIGAHGVGKTRLLHEMKRRIDKNPQAIACYVASCHPQGREHSFAAIGAMLRVLCGVREGDAEDRLRAVEPRLRALGLRHDEAELLLGELGVASLEPRLPARQALGAAITRMFGALASEKLHIFAWDNAQELDRESESVLRDVAGTLARKRLMLVFAARPVETTLFRDWPAYRQLELSELEQDDALRLVAQRLGVEQVPEDVLSFVRERASGHPMLIEELLSEAVASGVLVVKSGRVEQLAPAPLAVPRSLRGLLEQRVRRLSPTERDLLVGTAVVGRSADSAVLAAVLSVSLGELNRAAESLVTKQLLRRDGAVTLTIASPMLAELLLERLEPEVLAELNRRAAQVLITLTGAERRSADTIAHHLLKAGDRNAAADYFAESGLEHGRARRYGRAAADLARALDCAVLEKRSPYELAAWVRALSNAVEHARGVAVLEALLRRLVDHVGNAFAAELRGPVLVELGRMLASVGCYRDAHGLLERLAADEAAEVQQNALAARLEIAMEQGDFKMARALAEDLLAIPDEANAGMHRVLLNAARALAFAGDHDAAAATLARAASLTGADDQKLACERDGATALLAATRGDWTECEQAAESAAQRARSAGLLHDLAANLHVAGDALLRRGELARAYASLGASLACAEEMGFDRLAMRTRMLLAYLDALKGSAAAAEELTQLVQRAGGQGFSRDEILGRLLLGKWLARTGEYVPARRQLELAAQLADESGNRSAYDECRHELEQVAEA